MGLKKKINMDKNLIEEHPDYKMEIILHNARFDVKEEREEIEKEKKKRKGHRNALVTTAIYIGLLYVLYFAAHQLTGFQLFHH